MQGQKIRVRRKRQPRKTGAFFRLETEALAYIKRRARQLGISQARFLANAAGVAGPDMPPKFKFAFNLDKILKEESRRK